MEHLFLALLVIIMIGALASGFPVAFALPGSAIISIGLAAFFGYLFAGDSSAYFAVDGPKEWLTSGITNFRSNYWDVETDTLIAIPLCLIVIFLGMGGKASIINGPVISFEITQQGSNGLYLLYLMAIFLAVFAVSMLTQFTSYFMSSSHKLLKN